MDERQNAPDSNLPENAAEPSADISPGLSGALPPSEAEPHTSLEPHGARMGNADGNGSRRRDFRRNLFVLLLLALAAFILTAWVLVRLDVPFGVYSTGPQEIVRAQLRALDRGELRPAYNMFSARYRGQVSYEAWHELVASHWRMFHAEVVRTGTTTSSGAGVTLELYLHGSDDKDYRARFTLILTDGRWWIDDVHWTEEANLRDFYRT